MTLRSLQSAAGFFSLLLTLTGCTEQVVGGVEPDAPAPTALAILGSSMPADPDGFLKLAQITLQPDTLYVFIGNADQTCEHPFLDVAACNPNPYTEWQMVLGIPSARQTEGALSLPAAGVDAALALAGSVGPGDTCTGGVAPDGLKGDVAITGIETTQVTLQFSAVAPQAQIEAMPPSDITAEYQAVRCP